MRIAAWPLTLGPTGNPYPEALYGALRERGHVTEAFGRWRLLRSPPDILHVHWPENAVQSRRPLVAARRGAVLLALILLARLRGTKLVWTAHNLRPHEVAHPRLLRAYRGVLDRLIDGWIALGEASHAEVCEAFPRLARRPSFVIRHGDYRGSYPPADHGAPRRRSDAPQLLFFGQVRAYKGVPELIAAFTAWDRPGARLVVAGRPDDTDLATRLEAGAAQDPRIELRLRYVPEEEAAALFAGCDLVALPFREVLNSGSALLGLSFSRPVLLPESPPFAELRQLVGDAWVRTFPGALGPDDLATATTALPDRDARPDLTPFAWAGIAEQTEAAFERLSRGGR